MCPANTYRIHLWLNGAQAGRICVCLTVFITRREEIILALSTIDAKRRNNSCNLRCGDKKVVNQSTTQLMQGEEIILARSTKGEL